MDGKTQALLQQMNNKLNYLIAKDRAAEDATSTGAAVDFIVDMFDRADADSLGEYWELLTGEGVAIREKVCIPASLQNLISNRVFSITGSSSTSSAGNVVSYNNQISIGGNTYTSTSVRNFSRTEYLKINQLGMENNKDVKSKYQKKLNTENYNIKIIFYIDNKVENQLSPNFVPSLSDASDLFYVAISGGSVIFSNDYNFNYIYSFNGYTRPQINIPRIEANANVSGISTGGSYSLSSSVSLESFVLNKGTLGVSKLASSGKELSVEQMNNIVVDPVSDQDSVNIYLPPPADLTATYAIGTGISNSTSFDINSEIIGNITGSFEVLFAIQDDILTVSMNGRVVHTATSNEIVNRGGVGLYFRDVPMASIFANYGYLSGIKSFKAWRSDMPEPPDESGHGTYDAESTVQYQYSDKYHERQLENGQLIGYTYNPEA